MADPRARQNGHAIRAIREIRRMSREELAERIGCSEAALRNYETENRNIPPARLDKIATALDVDQAAIVRERPKTVVAAGIRSVDRSAVA